LKRASRAANRVEVHGFAFEMATALGFLNEHERSFVHKLLKLKNGLIKESLSGFKVGTYRKIICAEASR